MAMRIIKASRGTHEDMLEAFKNRLADLDVNSSTDIEASTEFCDVTENDLADILNDHGYLVDVTIPAVHEYLSSAAEVVSLWGPNKDDCCEEWYQSTKENYPEDLEWLVNPDASESEPVYL